jgi:hypothetical protein
VDQRSPGAGELVAGAGGALLLIATFLPWFALDSAVALPDRPGGVTVRGDGVNAWHAFAVIDVLLLAAALAAIALLAVRPALGRPVPQPLALAVAAAGAVCALLVVYRLLDPPDLVTAADTASHEIGRRLGSFFALLAAAGISWGGWRSTEAVEVPTPAVAEPAAATARAPIRRRVRTPGPPIRSAGVAEFEALIAQLEPLLGRLWDSHAVPRAEHATIPAAPGLYLFTRRDEPVHVGQAPDLRRRLAEQCRPSSGHTKATLAFEIAKRAARREGIDVDGPPARLATSDEFVPYFARAKEAVAGLPVRFLEVEPAELRILFEVYGPLTLGTGGSAADDSA